MATSTLSVGIVGGGLGGLTSAIAIARAGASVTVLEAASELGEIGAGIQMFGNVSRFLVRTGVDKIIGENLVQIEEAKGWGHDGGLRSYIDVKQIVRDQGFPWWVTRRDHLHAGLAEGARRHGAKIIVGFRVAELQQHGKGKGVTVVSEKGETHKFDLVIGADGVKSYVRKTLFPDLKPHSASNIAAYRCVVPYEEVFAQIPEARTRIGNTMDMWVGPGGYILLYPLTGVKELNIVTAYEQSRPVTELEDADLQEFRNHYKDWDPFVQKILGLVNETKRWPLNIIPPVKTWSNDDNNVCLQGDAAHAMQNHLAQGAATSMEDGIFLGRVLSEVLRGTISLETAIHLYEKKRIPRAFHKQQAALTQGQLLGVRGSELDSRNKSMSVEVKAWDQRPGQPEALPPTYRTSWLFASPCIVPSILYYDAEGDADFAVDEWLMEQGDIDIKTKVSRGLRAKWFSTITDNGVERWERSNGSKAKL